MGRPYDQQYFGAGSACTCGTMRCAGCGKTIDPSKGEWRAYKRQKHGDWGYVTHHRECCAEDPAWAKRDRDLALAVETAEQLRVDAAALIAKYPGWDVLTAIEDAAMLAEREKGGAK